MHMDKKKQDAAFLVLITILTIFLFYITHKREGWGILFFYIFTPIISYFVGKNNK